MWNDPTHKFFSNDGSNLVIHGVLVRLLLLKVLIRARVLLAIDLKPLVFDLKVDHAPQNDVAQRGQLLIVAACNSDNK